MAGDASPEAEAVQLAAIRARSPEATVEDLVVAKLEGARMGASTRQLEDVRAAMRLAGPSID